MKKVQFTETVLRDANQSLIATRLGYDQFEPILDTIDKAGFYSVECWGGATFDVCLRFLNEDPWERLRKIRKAMPNTPLTFGAILRPYNYGDKTPIPQATLAQVLRHACDGTGGFFVYTFPCMDARSFTAIAQAATILAKYEPFFQRGENHPERLAAAGLAEADSALLHDGKGNWLLVLLNPNTQPRKAKLDAAKLGLAGLPAEATIPPGGAIALPARQL